jgi:hypothetical protein
MKFTVTWKRSAEDELASIWLAGLSEDRARITEAVRLADTMLRYNPESVGESRTTPTERIVFVAPLTFTIEIREADRIVAVLAVHQIPGEQ